MNMNDKQSFYFTKLFIFGPFLRLSDFITIPNSGKQFISIISAL